MKLYKVQIIDYIFLNSFWLIIANPNRKQGNNSNQFFNHHERNLFLYAIVKAQVGKQTDKFWSRVTSLKAKTQHTKATL